MPRTPRADIRAQLTEAAAVLRSGHPELADAVDTVLGPNGWGALRRTDPASAAPGNLAIRVPPKFRDELQKRIAKDSDGRSEISKEANEGLRKFLAGKFVPPKPSRHTGTVNLNVRPDPELRRQVEAGSGGRDNKDVWGWDLRAAHVIVAWLAHKYGLTDLLKAPGKTGPKAG